jgi:hypothetical protein
MSHLTVSRATALFAALSLQALAACSDGDGPDGGLVTPDSGINTPDAANQDATGFPDARGFPDAELFVFHDGGAGRACNTTCNCPQGLACINSVCTALANPVYCCENPGCPSGEACLDLTERPSTCEAPPDGGADAGARDLGTGFVGAYCEEDTDCTEVPGMTCWTFQEPPFIWNYCTVEDCQTDLDCPGNARCLGLNTGPPFSGCFRNCSTDFDCDPATYCLPLPQAGFSVCFPDCHDDLFDCSPRDGSMWCNRSTGRCEPLAQQSATAVVGDACISNADCGPGDVCMGEPAWPFLPGGMCTRVCSGLPESAPCASQDSCQSFAGIGMCFRDCVGASCPNRANAVCTILDPSWFAPSCVPQ